MSRFIIDLRSMEGKLYTGTISFVHHQHHYATIEYTDGGKKKSINFQTDLNKASTLGISNRDKKHYFRSGDTVNFHIGLTPRGDRMNAYDVKFLYNNELEKLLQKARIDNEFKGFLKVADEHFFVKEMHSYVFFPLVFSPWEIKPPEEKWNEPVGFTLINLDKNNISAELSRPDFIPAYRQALKLFKTKTPADAVVTKITQYGVYVSIGSEALQTKLDVDDNLANNLQPGDKVKVTITYLSNQKIAVKRLL